MIIDKSLILNKIKTHFSFKSDAAFARFLDIKPQTLATWYSRNTFDIELLYAKCEGIDGNFLLTGKGEMLRNAEEKVSMVNEPREEYDKENIVIEALRNEIANKNTIIAGLERENKLLWKLVDGNGNNDSEGKVG